MFNFIKSSKAVAYYGDGTEITSDKKALPDVTPRPGLGVRKYDIERRKAYTPEEYEKILQDFEKNLGYKFPEDLKLSINNSNALDSVYRSVVPRSTSQIPSKIFNILSYLTPLAAFGGSYYLAKNNRLEDSRLAFNVGAALTAGVIGSKLMNYYAGSPYYTTESNEVYFPGVSQKNKDVLAHELGHYLAFEHNKGPYERGGIFPITGAKNLSYLNQGAITDEIEANILARKMLGEAAWKKSMLNKNNPALGSYFLLDSGFLGKSMQKEKLPFIFGEKNILPKNSLKNIDKLVNSYLSDKKLSDEDKRQRLQDIYDTIVTEENFNKMMTVHRGAPVKLDNNTIKWTTPELSKIPEFASAVQNYEMKKLF